MAWNKGDEKTDFYDRYYDDDDPDDDPDDDCMNCGMCQDCINLSINAAHDAVSAERDKLANELESTADKLSDCWMLLDDIARSDRDSDQTRHAAAAMLRKQQCPGWKD